SIERYIGSLIVAFILIDEFALIDSLRVKTNEHPSNSDC
ncbi:MAG: hypothetical protein RL069_2997, partial [Planctomycetota bacterium]